jgi:hypothetical protein
VNGVLQAYVKPSNTTLFPDLFRFGHAVALDGDTLAVGASDPSCATGVNGNQTNRGCPGAGAVYVFTRTGEMWSQQAYLKASNTEAADAFGMSVSLSGDTLAVGAPQEDSCARGINGNQADNTCQTTGAVYVFTRSGSTWSQEAYVKASNTANIDPVNAMFFGQTVSVSGNTLAVGAWAEASCAIGINGNQFDNRCLLSGAVYIFTRSNNVWTQEAYVKASNTAFDHSFGVEVALDGDTLAVGATGEAGCATGINGSQLNSSNCGRAGAVYVFTRTAGVWSQQAYVKASNTSAGDEFGQSLGLKGDILIVGAPAEDSCATGIDGNQTDEGCDARGAVYIFTRANSLWSQDAYVKPLPVDSEPFGIFGRVLAFDGTTLAVSIVDNNCARGFNPSPGSNDCHAAGAVFLFSRTATSWAQQVYVKASNTDMFDFFGGANSIGDGIAIAGNTLAVGAPSEDSCATGINGNQNDNGCGPNPIPEAPPTYGSGAVYVYVGQ